MQALVARRLDGPDTLELVDTAVPEPGPGQVRIKVAGAAVNPIDLVTTRRTLLEHGLTAPREQFGLGWDVAGTVDAVGPSADLGPGTPVVGLCDLLGRALKTHAEYVVLDADAVAPAPASVDLVAASTFVLNALTAQQSLDALALSPGQTVLVTGAAGGLGGYAVELSRHYGLTVVAVAGTDDEELVRAMGAALFVPRSADLATAVRDLVPGGVDGLVDAAVLGIGAQEAIRNRGVHAHVVAGTPPPSLRGISVHQILVHASRQALVDLVRLVDSGAITTRVAGTYRLDEAATAYDRLAKGGVRGRLVLTPQQP